jgi:PIN domain nuclease of toxin-antitoxin system
VRFLLDTCTLLWMGAFPDRLSSRASVVVSDDASILFVSPVSVWELAMKERRGRLEAGMPLPEFLRQAHARFGLKSLSFDETAALQGLDLPSHHKDPFDRMLVCQARAHDLVLVTPDSVIQAYDVPVIW